MYQVKRQENRDKKRKQKMPVSGKSVFLIQSILIKRGGKK